MSGIPAERPAPVPRFEWGGAGCTVAGRSGAAIRPARRSDAPAIAALFAISSEGLAHHIWRRIGGSGRDPLAVGAERYARTGTAFSFENCLVAVEGDRVLGMAHAFAMGAPEPEAPPEPDPVLAPYARLEAPGTLYLSGLAVAPSRRGRGVGTALLRRTAARAVAEDLSALSLICFEENRRARALYERTGFTVADRAQIVPHPLLHVRGGDALLMIAPAETVARATARLQAFKT